MPIGSRHSKRDFYVDDLLTGADSLAEAMTIRNEILQLMKLGSFSLGKWSSNCPDLLQGVSEQGESLVIVDKDVDFRILGILSQ